MNALNLWARLFFAILSTAGLAFVVALAVRNATSGDASHFDAFFAMQGFAAAQAALGWTLVALALRRPSGVLE